MKRDHMQEALYILKELMESLLIFFICVVLFFSRPIGLLILSPYAFICVMRIKNKVKNWKRERILIEFRDALNCMALGLEAGLSLESAVCQVEADLSLIYGKNSFMGEKFEEISKKLELNEPLDKLFYRLGDALDIDEIRVFAEVYSTAQRAGGNTIGLFRLCHENIYEKQQMQREIDQILSSNRMECQIMKAMPLGIIAYLRLFSGEFLAPLYGTVLGHVVMVVAAFSYLLLVEYSDYLVRSALTVGGSE